MATRNLDQQRTDNATMPTTLFRRWRHSREEDVEGVQVYRPDGFDFPPARGREGFQIFEDGRFVLEEIDPTDGVLRVPGHWQQVGSRRLAVRFADPARPGFALQVLDLDESVLRVHRITRHVGPGLQVSSADPAQLSDFVSKPPPSAFRIIAFDTAKIAILQTFPTRHVLEVSGRKPFANMAVDLVPVVYVRQPDLWEIEVVGSLPGIALPAKVPYTVSMSLDGTLGRCGIEVVGANRRQQFDLFCDSTEE